MKNVIFILCGNCRTFIDCIDSIYNHLIFKLFPENAKIYMYLYLKLTDPGPKGQDGWNFEYKDIHINLLLDKINDIKNKYPTIQIDYKLLDNNEISDTELFSQLKNRNLYYDYYAMDNHLVRGMHCHYNFEKCGFYILEKEKLINCKFDYIIYVRPDLYFTKSSKNIDMYNTSIVTLGKGPYEHNNDHLAIIPRQFFDCFFFDRINIYRNNTVNRFTTPEDIYWHTITFEVKEIGQYYIKRY